jgi:hypothetical protein
MADPYETPQEDAADTAPETPAENAPEQGNAPAKMSQQEANYREGNPQRSCGLCGHFDSKDKACDVVEGEISPYGFSDLYLRQDNPFRIGEKEGFKGGTKIKIALTPAAAVMPTAPLRIGGKLYG